MRTRTGWTTGTRAALAGLTLALAACSGGDGTTLDTATTRPPPTTIADTTAPAPTSTAAPTTDAPSTTEPTTTTTTIEFADVEAQIRADFERTVQLRLECDFEPTECDFAGVAVPGSRYDVGLRELMARRSTEGLRARPGFGDFRFWIESVTVKGDEAVVLVCAVDSVILFDVRNPEDSTDDIIFDESTVSSRTEWVVRKTGRGWVRSSGETAAEVVGEGLCDA